MNPDSVTDFEAVGSPGREPAAPPLPLLVTGISGVSGYNAFHMLRRHFGDAVWGLRQVNNRRLNHAGVLPCDAEDESRLTRLFEEHRFAAVLNCGGNCALRSCELDPQMAYRINVRAVEVLLSVLRRFPARLVHLSIDLVFSGIATGDYDESDPTDPVTVYGKTMVAAEQRVQAACSEACIARISLPMGMSFSGHAGAIDWIQSRFRQNRPATLYFDEIRTPTYTDCLTRVCCELLRRPVPGLVHAGGPRALSLYEIAQIVNRVGGYDPHLLHGCFRNEAGPLPPRAGNVSMCSQKLGAVLERTPFLPWPADPCFVPSHHDWHWDRAQAWQGSPELLRQVLYQIPARFRKPC